MIFSYVLLRIIAGIIACFDLIFSLFENTFSEMTTTFAHHVLGICQMIFFMLSGRFLLAKKYENLTKFYLGRIIKIGIPFLLASLLILISQIGFSFRPFSCPCIIICFSR